MRTVMVTKFVPQPADSGGKQRSLAILTRLAERGPTVLCAFDDGAADLDGLAAIGVEVRAVPWTPSTAGLLRGTMRTGSGSAGRFWNMALRREVLAATAEPPDLLQVEYAQLVPYAKGVSARTRVLDLHNVESELVKSMAALRARPARLALGAEAMRLRRLERAGLRSFDATVVVSERDRARLPTNAPVLVCPNGWQTTGPLPAGKENVVAFVGLLGWGPNEDAAVWLARDVWPAVRARVPDAKLLLIGRDPSRKVLALQSTDVEVTGSVPEIAPYLARARVATAPLRAGGGSRLKILEALDAARPVVATTLGAEGLEDLIGQGIVLADSPDVMATKIVDLLHDRGRTERLGRAGHAAVGERYSWAATLRPLLEFVDARSGGYVAADTGASV
jgi:glycosyltransferase involved in cell wall biosynthesis